MAITDPSGPFQSGAFAALNASADVLAAFTAWSDGAIRVYDRVPAQAGQITAKFPYLTIGEDQVLGEANGCHDNSEIWAKVEAWSQPAVGSKLEVKALAAAARAALDTAFPVTGFHIVTHRLHSILYRREPDGITERAIITFRHTLEPA